MTAWLALALARAGRLGLVGPVESRKTVFDGPPVRFGPKKEVTDRPCFERFADQTRANT